MAIDEIQTLVRERGSALSRADMERITTMAVDVPLDESDQLGSIFEAIALVVNDPEYSGDIEPIE